MPTHPSSDTGQDGPPTRTRMPEGHSGYGAATRRTKPSRALVTVLGVVVLLIAVIVLANRGTDNTASDGSTGGAKGTGANPTAPTGEKPATGNNAGIPSGYARTEQGAQSAAANFAVALGGDGMFKADQRHRLVDAVYTAGTASKIKSAQDLAYSKDFLRKLGLNQNGDAPSGMTFISRTIPVGTKSVEFKGDRATIEVWYTALIGMAGPGSTDPVRSNWQTWTFDLRWTGDDWKVAADTQEDGPAPVPGDVPASSADDITKAVQQYGGFTYAR